MVSAILAKTGNNNFMPTSFFGSKSCQHYFIQRPIQSAVFSPIRTVLCPPTRSRKTQPVLKISTKGKVGNPPIFRFILCTLQFCLRESGFTMPFILPCALPGLVRDGDSVFMLHHTWVINLKTRLMQSVLHPTLL